MKKLTLIIVVLLISLLSLVGGSALAQVTSPEITVDPIAGPASNPITVHGVGWQYGSIVTINVIHQDTNYLVSTVQVDAQGQFTLSFFIPDAWKTQPQLTIGAVSGTSSAQAFYTITDAAFAPTPDVPQATDPQGVVTINSLNVRSGPGTNYPVLGRVMFNQVVYIIGQNNGWWQIKFPSAYGQFGWVSGTYLSVSNTGNVPFVTAPPPPRPDAATSAPLTPSQQCSPGAWSGCGSAVCQNQGGPQYVSQCGNNGQWQPCVWDPGHCTADGNPVDENHHEADNHSHHHYDNNASNQCDSIDNCDDYRRCLAYYNIDKQDYENSPNYHRCGGPAPGFNF